MNNLIIRPIRLEETMLLLDFLYEAIYQSEPSQPIPRTILQQPPLWKYIENFGSRKAYYHYDSQGPSRIFLKTGISDI